MNDKFIVSRYDGKNQNAIRAVDSISDAVKIVEECIEKDRSNGANARYCIKRKEEKSNVVA